MDFNNRSSQLTNPSPRSVSSEPAPKHSSKYSKDNMWGRAGIVAGLFAVVILLVGIICLLYANNTNTKDTESKYIYGNKLQAVFLNTGQVYFGNISVLNNNFLVLNNIFYLQTTSTASSSSSSSSSSANSNVTLVKLGCELHMPYDQMVINRAQVTFWENLQSNGQVAKAVATWDSEHPNGQQCTDQSSSSSSTTNSVQNAPAK